MDEHLDHHRVALITRPAKRKVEQPIAFSLDQLFVAVLAHNEVLGVLALDAHRFLFRDDPEYWSSLIADC